MSLHYPATRCGPADCADAWAQYAYALSLSAGYTVGFSEAEKWATINRAVDRALQLEPDHLLARVVRATGVGINELRHQEGVEALAEIAHSYPSFLEGQYAMSRHQVWVGLPDDSLTVMRRVLDLDPLNLVRRRVYAEHLVQAGQLQAALDVIEELLDLGGQVSDVEPYLDLLILLDRGKRRELYERIRAAAATDIDPDDDKFFRAAAEIYRIMETGALSSLAELRGDRYVAHIASAALAVGALEAAVELLTPLVDDRSFWGRGNIPMLSRAMRLPEETLGHPNYVSFWLHPNLLDFARVRKANGATQAIPPAVLREPDQG